LEIQTGDKSQFAIFNPCWRKIMSSHLAEVARQKKQQWLNFFQESRHERENWKKKVDQLYTQIKQWLSPLEAEGLLRYKEETQPVRSIWVGEGIEAEMRDELTIEFFNGETIKLEQVCLEIIGAYGRLDMKLGLHQIRIELCNNLLHKLSIRINLGKLFAQG
jgi:Zn-dependent M32 family carboxypeptidase